MKFQTTALLIGFLSFSALSQEAPAPAEVTSKATLAEIAKNKADGEAFLAKNAKAPGVVVLPSGLQYKVIEKGSGKIPTTNNLVFIKYHGRLVDGTEFDHHNHFLTWTTGGIKGWQEALQKMKVGAKWQIFVPPDLAFGDEGEEYLRIGPKSTLIYDLELLSIAPPNPELATGGLGHGLEERSTDVNSPDAPKK